MKTWIQSLSKLCLSVSIGLLLVHPAAQAAIQRSADFSEGSTLGIGLYGLSYDYGIGGFSAGLNVSSSASYGANSYSPFNSPLRPSLRLMGRVYQQEGLSAGIFGGLFFDPGNVGERAYLVPDLGLGIAYDFKQFNVPLALRLNMSVALGDPRRSYSNPEDSPVSANFFQRLMMGPNTSLELAWLPTETLEVTLGGGTLVGMRMKF